MGAPLQDAMGKEEVPPVPSRITPAGRPIECWNDELFSQLRKDAGIADEFLNEGWDYDKLEKGGGKGGTLMAFLWGKYIVKEMSEGDHKAMLEVTPSYVEHLHAGIEKGTPSRICAVYLHYRDIQSKRIFFAMKNEVGNGPFQALYDLKGCADDKTLELDGSPVEAVHKRIWNLSMWCGRCMWDETRRKYYKGKEDARHLQLPMPTEQRNQLLSELAYDMEWLASHRLMDYSLLVATKSTSSDADADKALKMVNSSGGTDLLYLSIIDFLQKWTCGKRCARGLKFAECNKATVPPRMYADRFQRHFAEVFVARELPQTIGAEAGLTQIAPAAGSSDKENFNERRE